MQNVDLSQRSGFRGGLLAKAAQRARTDAGAAEKVLAALDARCRGEGWIVATVADLPQVRHRSQADRILPETSRSEFEADASSILEPEGVVVSLGSAQALVLMKSPVKVDAELAFVQLGKSIARRSGKPCPQLPGAWSLALPASDPAAKSSIAEKAGT